MLWVRQLAPAVADFYGAGRMMIIYTVAGAVGFLFSSAMGWYSLACHSLAAHSSRPAPRRRFSASLGALVYYGRRTGSSMAYAEAMRYAVILFVFGLISRGVDNHAHAGGFVGGYLAGMWLDPMTRERVDHLIVGVFCIVVTFGAVGASIVAGIPDTLAYFMQF